MAKKKATRKSKGKKLKTSAEITAEAVKKAAAKAKTKETPFTADILDKETALAKLEQAEKQLQAQAQEVQANINKKARELHDMKVAHQGAIAQLMELQNRWEADNDKGKGAKIVNIDPKVENKTDAADKN